MHFLRHLYAWLQYEHTGRTRDCTRCWCEAVQGVELVASHIIQSKHAIIELHSWTLNVLILVENTIGTTFSISSSGLWDSKAVIISLYVGILLQSFSTTSLHLPCFHSFSCPLYGCTCKIVYQCGDDGSFSFGCGNYQYWDRACRNEYLVLLSSWHVSALFDVFPSQN